ncbi:5426_t:CDS:1, partial [Dentiscutata heterogama]
MDEDHEILTNKRQILESKAVALQRLVDHINVELTANNLQHVESIVNNLNHAFTILSDIEKAKSHRKRRTTW